jgi:hypothetical protein
MGIVKIGATIKISQAPPANITSVKAESDSYKGKGLETRRGLIRELQHLADCSSICERSEPFVRQNEMVVLGVLHKVLELLQHSTTSRPSHNLSFPPSLLHKGDVFFIDALVIVGIHSML